MTSALRVGTTGVRNIRISRVLACILFPSKPGSSPRCHPQSVLAVAPSLPAPSWGIPDIGTQAYHSFTPPHTDTLIRQPSTITPTQSCPEARRTPTKQIPGPRAQPQDAVLALSVRQRWTPAGTAQRVGYTPWLLTAAAVRVREISVVSRHTLVPSQEGMLLRGSVGSRPRKGCSHLVSSSQVCSRECILNR